MYSLDVTEGECVLTSHTSLGCVFIVFVEKLQCVDLDFTIINYIIFIYPSFQAIIETELDNT